MDRFAPCRAETAKQATVKASLEGHNAHLRSAGRSIHHRRAQFLRSEIDIGSTPLLLPPPHERSLVRQLVGIRTSLCSEYLVQSFRGDRQDASLQDFGPVVLREIPQRWPVDK